MGGQIWTDEEIGFLTEHQGRSAVWLADELGRSAVAVRKMRARLAAGYGASSRAPWTEDEEAFILANPDFTSQQLAEHLGRSARAVRQRLSECDAPARRGSSSPHSVGSRTLLAKTCPRCGLLLTPKWFGRDGKGNWVPHCIRCRPATKKAKRDYAARNRAEVSNASRDFFKKMQDYTRDRADRHGQEWVDADHEILRDPEVPILVKALRLGRTYSAVAGQCSKNGYRSLVGHGDPIKGQWVIDNPNATQPEGAAA